MRWLALLAVVSLSQPASPQPATTWQPPELRTCFRIEAGAKQKVHSSVIAFFVAHRFREMEERFDGGEIPERTLNDLQPCAGQPSIAHTLSETGLNILDEGLRYPFGYLRALAELGRLEDGSEANASREIPVNEASVRLFLAQALIGYYGRLPLREETSDAVLDRADEILSDPSIGDTPEGLALRMKLRIYRSEERRR